MEMNICKQYFAKLKKKFLFTTQITFKFGQYIAQKRVNVANIQTLCTRKAKTSKQINLISVCFLLLCPSVTCAYLFVYAYYG